MSRAWTPEEVTTRETYDAVAGLYEELNPLHWKDQAWYDFTWQLPAGGLVLDLGCGTWRDAYLYVSDGFRYVGVDFSMEMLKAGIDEGSETKVASADMLHLPFRDNTFDGLHMIASLMHIPRNNVPGVVQEGRRVLKPGGLWWIATPAGKFEGMYAGHGNIYGGLKAFVACWLLKDLSELLVSAGLEVTMSYEMGSMLNFIVRKV